VIKLVCLRTKPFRDWVEAGRQFGLPEQSVEAADACLNSWYAMVLWNQIIKRVRKRGQVVSSEVLE
jgi:hypothetical protein